MISKRKIVFLTGTRADYGKIKPVARALRDSGRYDVYIFATGMHLLHRYGYTVKAVMREFPDVYLFNNQASSTHPERALASTINGFSSFVSDLQPDMILVHGDRPEALAGAIVGSFNNLLVAHIEGGEVSGTIDEAIRHSITKLAHIHLVSNNTAQARLIQLGERKDKIFVVGSPEVDIMLSAELPTLVDVKAHYEIPFDHYAISILHPVTTELENQEVASKSYFHSLAEVGGNFIVVHPNNDLGGTIIEKQLEFLQDKDRFRVFPSIEFESFLTLLKHCLFIIGNSSAGIREAPVFNRWSVNIGSRQHQRSSGHTIIHVSEEDPTEIREAINHVREHPDPPHGPNFEFGDGNSVGNILNTFSDNDLWNTSRQKQFIPFS